ncbi:hypothetical protein ACFL3Y_01155 [Pseudomonadota bacterium]
MYDQIYVAIGDKNKMFFIWRGYGWLVPVILLASSALMLLIIDPIYGDGYYKAHIWPAVIASLISAIPIGFLGYTLNHKNRLIGFDDETGKTKKSPSHSLFFIPVEYWSVIVPVLFIWLASYSVNLDNQTVAFVKAPMINDLYLADFSEIFEDSDKEFKFGVMKVTAVNVDDVEIEVSATVYEKKSGLRRDISNGKADAQGYFAEGRVGFTKKELMELKELGAIFSVSRDEKK